jgi:hypothetical protein
MGVATKAGALRWFAERVGREVDTVQVRPNGMSWEPGLRTVERQGASAFALDGSTMRIDRDHVVLEVSGERVRLEWLDSDGVTIHVTTYSDPPAEVSGDDE